MTKLCTTCDMRRPRSEFLRGGRKAYLVSPCRSCRAAKARQFRAKNRDRAREKERIRAATPERLAWRREYRRRKMADPAFRLSAQLRIRLSTAIRRGRAGSAVRDAGCTLIELQQHLSRQFSPGMSWGNYGAWHIDHIRPIASFDLRDRAQFLQAVHYSNLQPLWASDNCRKNARRA